MATTIQFKRGLNANLATATLLVGEPAFVTDTGKFYVGDGAEKVLINPIDKPVGITPSVPYTKVTVNDYGQVTAQASLTESDIPNISYTKVTGLGTAAIVDTGTAAGQIPVLDANAKVALALIPDIPSSQVTGLGTAAAANLGTAAGNVPQLDVNGKLETSVIPSIAITNTYVVADEAAMLALDCQVGDIAVRTDINSTFILQTAPPSVLSNWVQLATPTDSVTSVNGQTGAVTLGASNILMTGYTLPGAYSAIVATDNTSEAIGKLERNFNNYAPLASPTFTGSPTAPTPTAGNDSTLVATTAFVQTALSTIDGGTF